MYTLTKYLKGFWVRILPFFLLLGLAEWSYRQQWVDYYDWEFAGLNLPATRARKAQTWMIFGDSFTANERSYVATLRKQFPNTTFLNHAVPGTGVFEATLMANRRLSERPFDGIVYQIFVGNDLVNVRKTVNWEKSSLIRNVYYLISDKVKVLEYLNFQFRKFKSADQNYWLKPKSFGELQADSVFSPEAYSPFERRMLSADSTLISDCVLLRNGRKSDFDEFVQQIDAFLAKIPSDTVPVYLLVIPHSTQVSEHYRENFAKLNFPLPADSNFTAIEYPFFKSLVAHYETRPNIKIVNLLPALRAAEIKGQKTYYENDFHVTEKGQQVLAGCLSNYLKPRR